VQVETAVLAVLRSTLGIHLAAPPIVRAAVPQWDSLKHINLIFALEDEFELEFDEQDIERMISYDEIVALVWNRKKL
jgi:acyl carrier protein